MKSKKILLAILAVALVLGMSACDTGSGSSSGGNPSGNTTETYESVGDDGTIYKLVINSARAASRAAAGDTFVLTITKLNGTTSTISGSVQNVANGAIILAPKNGGTITVTPSGRNMGLTTEGTIKDDSGTVISFNVYALGSTGPGGGKVFYYDAAGFTVTGYGTCHYLEAAPDDMPSIINWSADSVSLSGTSTDLGAGRKNTDLIVAAYPDATVVNNAAKACKDYTVGGKSDWFLPSKDELDKLYNGKDYVGNMKTTATTDYYWSSSQGNNDGSSSTAWYQFFSDGFQSLEYKINAKYVRAIRAF